MRRAVLILALLATLLPAAGAHAWSDAAHTTICEIAFRELTPSTRDEVRRLIRLDDEFRFFSDACTWPDHPRRRAREHFVNVARDAVAISPDDPCPLGDVCVVTAINVDLAVLKDAGAGDAEKLRSLEFLGHWVGDIHQPLHVSFFDDRGGNAIRESGPCRFSLHTVWDDCLFERTHGNDAVAAANALRATITDEQRVLWTSSGPVGWESLASPARRRWTCASVRPG